MTLWPTVELSVPLLVAGMSSARRNPVWMFVVEGAKMDLSDMEREIGWVCCASKREGLRFAGRVMSSANVRSGVY